jgi:ribose 5-phosphate isomerase B
MRIVLAADHGGFDLKEKIKQHLEGCGDEVIDVGALEHKARDGFTDYCEKAVERIREKDGTMGIFVCRTGTLAAMAANRYEGIRAAMCHMIEYAVRAREHNDANVLCLGGDFLEVQEAQKIVEVFLSTKFLGGKYQKRLAVLDK